MSSHREVLETWFKRVWAEEDAGAIDEMLINDTKARGLGSQTRVGPGDFKDFQHKLLQLVGDVDMQIDDCLESGDWIAALCTCRATCRKTGKPVQLTGQMHIKIVDGALVEAYNQFDFMGLYESLGLLPTGTFDRCLNGESLT